MRSKHYAVYQPAAERCILLGVWDDALRWTASPSVFRAKGFPQTAQGETEAREWCARFRRYEVAVSPKIEL